MDHKNVSVVGTSSTIILKSVALSASSFILMVMFRMLLRSVCKKIAASHASYMANVSALSKDLTKRRDLTLVYIIVNEICIFIIVC